MKHIKTNIFLATSVFVLGISGYYFQSNNLFVQAAEQEVLAAPQAMPVTVETINAEVVQIWNEYSARLEAVHFAEIRPQVSGTITEVKFEDGQEVNKGDVLFVIDPRPYQALVNQAKAELHAAKNQVDFSSKQLKRAEELIKNNAISQRLLDERMNAYNVAVDNVRGIEARLTSAQINLDFAYVKAPISGRVSRAEVKEGNLVETAVNAPVLTSIVSQDKIYADFEVDEQTYLKYIRATARDLQAEHQIPVKLKLTGDDVQYEGYIQSFDNQINVSSGTIRARALFKNDDGVLLPGMFASIQVGTPSSNDLVLISERAIGTNQNRKFVYVVNEQNITEYREVEIGKSIKGQRIITSGLNIGELIITEGIIRIQPGMPVIPQTKDQLLGFSE